jgi:hypothetical protein
MPQSPLLPLLLLLPRPADAAIVPADIRARLTFANGSAVDAAPLVRLALFGPPNGKHFAAAHALGRKGTFLYHPSATDGGDTACQGGVNVDQIGLLATPELVPVARNWLTTAVVRQPTLPNTGQVWSQPGGPYHGFGQGAMEANAEFILMAALYASYTGDRALFCTAPERLLCAELGEGQWSYVGVGKWTSDACTTRPGALLDAHPQLYGDSAKVPHITVPRGKSKPGLYPGQGTILVSRVTLPSTATALSLALSADEDANFTVCVRDIASDTVVDTIARRGLSGWFTVRPAAGAQFPAGAYDVAVQTQTGSVTWLSDSSPASSGGARTEVYDEGAVPKGCCGKHEINSTLAGKLERAMAWQLNLSRKGSSANSSDIGMFVTADGRFSGQPVRAKGVTSSSAMWDQVRMGWKAGYPALRVLGSLVAWRELAAAGLVAPAGVSEELVQSVRDDIVAQLGQPDGTLLSWRSCEVQEGVTLPPSGLPSSSCDRDDPHAPHQRSFDLGFVPDHALAVKLGVIKPHVLLDMMPKIRHKSGHRLAIKPFEDQYMGGFIMVDSEKWTLVNNGFALPSPEQTGWSQVFAPPRTDGPGNFNNHEQNGGRLFSVSKMVLEAVLYPEAAVDWAEQVRGSTAIAAALLGGPVTPGGNCSAPLPHPSLVRTSMAADSLAHKYCEVAYGCTRALASCAKDCFGKSACDYYGDMTWGLRDGQLGPILELLKGLLGLRLHPDGTMHLYHKTVDPSSCTAATPCWVQLAVPQETAATWPADIAAISLGGINVGKHHNCSIDAAVNYTSAKGVALAYTIWSSQGAPVDMHAGAAVPPSLKSDDGAPPPTTNVTCCVPPPIPGNQTKAGCEAGGDAKHNGGTYHYNTGKGTPTAACGQHAACNCCRIGPKPTRKGGKPICDPLPPPPGADTNTIVFKDGGSPSLTYVPPGDPGAHSKNGTLLAFSGATRLRSSTNHGHSWSNPSNPVAPSGEGAGSGAQTVYDPHRHTVFLQFGNVSSVKVGCDIGEEQLNGIKQLQSTDAGASWGNFVDVEKQLVKEGVPVPAGGPRLGPGTCLGPTGGEALVMRPVHGKYGGRMVFCAVQNAYQGDIPVWSDDGGKTFNFSAGVYKKGLDECSIAQTANGSLLLIARNCHNSNLRQCQMRRQLAMRNDQEDPGQIGSHTFAVSMSHDGGESWGPITQQPQLITPVCQASIISYKGPKDAAPALYFSHPFSTTSRSNGTILASNDNGATFSRALNLAIPTQFGYTGLACGLVGAADGTDCAVLYDAAHKLRLKRFASSNVE